MRLAAAVMLVLLAMPAAAAQSDGPAIGLATAAPGHRDPNAWYGHSAIVVVDGLEVSYYTYRLGYPEGVGGAGRAFASALGEAHFRLIRIPFSDAVEDYRSQGRELRVLPLELPTEDAEALVEALEAERSLTRLDPHPYHAIDDNCATRIRDFVDLALGGRLHGATRGEPVTTPREAFTPYLAHDPLMAGTLSLLIGPHGDRAIDAWDAMFLPERLEAEVTPLVAGRAVVAADAEADVLRPAASTGWVAPLIALLGLGSAGLGLMVRSGRAAWGTGVAATIAGLTLAGPAFLVALAWIGGPGPYFANNGNVLLLSPLVWALVPVGVWSMRSVRGRRWLRELTTIQAVLALAGAASRSLPGDVQQNVGWLIALVPVHVGLAAACWLADRPRLPILPVRWPLRGSA